jgi:hypothetical protein
MKNQAVEDDNRNQTDIGDRPPKLPRTVDIDHDAKENCQEPENMAEYRIGDQAGGRDFRGFLHMFCMVRDLLGTSEKEPTLSSVERCDSNDTGALDGVRLCV